MRLRLKENPREWQKFTAVTSLLFGLIAFMLHAKKVIALKALIGAAIFLLIAIVVCLVRPRWFRGYYRAGTTISFAIGSVMSRIFLGLFFIGVLTPLALIARITGKNLLKLKRDVNATSYWQPSKASNQFDREF